MDNAGRIVVDLKLESGAVPPRQAYDDDAGWDLASFGDATLQPGKLAKLRTGVSVGCTGRLWCRIVPRSSTMWKYGVQVMEGIIDTGWRGELLIVAINHGDEPVFIPHGTRMGQIIFRERCDVEFRKVAELDDTERGTNGFGSSGK